MAIARDCKYVEVSASLGHNVDTLLVGVVKQIRLKLAELAERSSYARWRKGGVVTGREIFNFYFQISP